MNEEQRIKKNKYSLKRQKQNARAVVETRWRNKMRLIDYKGGKCERCGYNSPIAAVYHFHHIDPENKKFTLGRCMTRSIERLKSEADKCELLCANCHAEEHDKEYSTAREQTIQSWEEWDIDEQSRRKRREKALGYCPQCEQEFIKNFNTQKFCSPECRIESQKKVERPSRDELDHLIKQHSWTYIGKMYGVSDNAVRKWARKYMLLS